MKSSSIQLKSNRWNDWFAKDKMFEEHFKMKNYNNLIRFAHFTIIHEGIPRKTRDSHCHFDP